MQRKVHSGIINLFDERIVYSPDKDSVCSKRGTTELPEEMFKEVMNDLWLARISSLSNEVRLNS
jgi:hypothetical protein